MNKKENGFGHIGVILLILVIAIVAGVVFYVVSKQEKKPEKVNLQNTSEPAKNTKTETKLTTTFNDKDGLYSLELPKDWTAEYYRDSILGLKPKDLKIADTEPNWVVWVSVLDLPSDGLGGTFKDFDEFKEMKLREKSDSSPVNELITLNGSPVWKFGQTIKDNSPTGPPELSGGYQYISYYFYGNKSKIIDINIKLYQNATINYQGTKINSSYDYSQYKTEYEAIVKSFKLN